ncbi:hypothetical protein [Dysgonomonas sp. BGC7]|uniref:hypothetical protein n=1 Tax=Dysgonomonas sp. BGC7 TaxID=1658008 RepID=UPI000682C1FB|nr:hypothetical protein [Dysgonomonas sp. BGC7]MBD8390049.1 hypothetical protein [Dysgonomonas sp. BGC7]
MKKLVLFAVAVVAISLASCGDNKAKLEAEQKRIQDSIAAVEAEAAAQAAAAQATADSIAKIAADSIAALSEKK